MLNTDITKEEVIKAIKEMKIGKSPGPDSLTAKFYKTIKNKIALNLSDLMNDVMKEAEIPRSCNQASIALIPKENLGQSRY